MSLAIGRYWCIITRMESMEGLKCINCPVFNDWSVEAEEVQASADLLSDALANPDVTRDQIFKRFMLVAMEEGRLDTNVDNLLVIKNDEVELNKQTLELIDGLRKTADEIRKDATELTEGCPGPVTLEQRIGHGVIVISRVCMSPQSGSEGSVEPAYIERRSTADD